MHARVPWRVRADSRDGERSLQRHSMNSSKHLRNSPSPSPRPPPLDYEAMTSAGSAAARRRRNDRPTRVTSAASPALPLAFWSITRWTGDLGYRYASTKGPSPTRARCSRANVLVALSVSFCFSSARGRCSSTIHGSVVGDPRQSSGIAWHSLLPSAVLEANSAFVRGINKSYIIRHAWNPRYDIAHDVRWNIMYAKCGRVKELGTGIRVESRLSSVIRISSLSSRDDYTCDLAHTRLRASNEPGIAQRWQHVVVKKPLVYRVRTFVRGSLTLVPQKSFTNAIRHTNRLLARQSDARDAREGVSSRLMC